MPDFPEIFVLRHGETEWNRIGRHQGRLDSPLTERGRGQAGDQADILRELLKGRGDVSAHCSPQGRAFNTAAIALAPLGLTAKTDERLCEISFGDWQGLTLEQISDGWPEQVRHLEDDPFGWHFHAPGGESYDDMAARVREFLSSLTGPAVIVSHGVTSRVMRGVWLGQGADELSALPGGQGCVYHLKDGQHRRFPAL